MRRRRIVRAAGGEPEPALSAANVARRHDKVVRNRPAGFRMEPPHEDFQPMGAMPTPENRSRYRVNVIDHMGTISFLAPPHGLKVLAAAITKGARNGGELLAFAHAYDAEWAMNIRVQVMRFDEHNVDAVSDEFVTAIGAEDTMGHPAFRVFDAETRARSLVPGRLGLVVFNLKERRIIQVQNNYADLQRKDRGRIRVDGEPIDLLFHYELPREWSLVP